MSQAIFADIDPDVTSGTQLATLLNLFKDAIRSGFKGTSVPPNLSAGGYWIDDTLEATPNFIWDLYIYTGTSSIKLFRINLSTLSVTSPGSDSSFSITKTSADTVGPILQLIKKRIASSGQDLIGDVIAEIQCIGRGSDSSNPVVARMRAIATDNMTGSLAGATLVWEQINTGTAALVEAMRLLDGKLGVGTTTPDATIHAVGTGIKSGRLADDAVGAKFISKKSRIAGTKATQNNDVIFQQDILSTDQLSADLQVVKIEVKATEAHTSTAGGTQWKLAIAKVGSATLTDKITISDKITTMKEGVSIEAPIIEQQNIATSASISNLDASKGIVRFTGATATNLFGILSSGNAKVITIHNSSSAIITVKNDDGSTGTAADRFMLPSSADMFIKAGSSAEFFYSTSDSRWKVKSGSGSGSGGGYAGTSGTTSTIASGGTITTTTTDQRQAYPVKGASLGVAASITPFGSSGGWLDLTEILLVGMSDADFLTLTNNDNNYGVVGPFSTLDLTNYKTAKLVWFNSQLRWVLDLGGV